MEHIKKYWVAYLIVIGVIVYMITRNTGNAPRFLNREGNPCIKTYQGCQTGGARPPEGFVCPPGSSWDEIGIWKNGKCDTSMNANRP